MTGSSTSGSWIFSWVPVSSRTKVLSSHCSIKLIAVRLAGLPAFLMSNSGSSVNKEGNKGGVSTGAIIFSADVSMGLSVLISSVELLLACNHKIAAKICLQQPAAEQSQLAC